MFLNCFVPTHLYLDRLLKFLCIRFKRSLNDELISRDFHVRIVGPLPGVDKPILSCINEEWIDKHIVINYSMDGYNFIKMMMDMGVVEDYHKLL